MSAEDLIRTIKKASVDAVLALNPVNLLFGTVTSDAPLEITLEQNLILTNEQLILLRNVTDFEVFLTFEHETELEGSHVHEITIPSGNFQLPPVTGQATQSSSAPLADGTAFKSAVGDPEEHVHVYKSEKDKSIIIHNALVTGDVVFLIRMQGGQKYIVVDRVGVSA